MKTSGVQAVYLETHNWGKAAKFFQSLGFELDFETDHNSGQLRSSSGPYIFVAEIPADREPQLRLALGVSSTEGFDPGPGVEVVTPLQDTHWGTKLMTVRDPDGRQWSIEGPGSPMTVAAAADTTAVRVALWRAMHVQVDAPPHVLDDTVGLELAAPDGDWRSRPDMNPNWTRGFRAAIVGRARFIEDLVVEQTARGVAQYVLLGAGLDTFAQRRPDLAGQIRLFEIDRPAPQAWKRQRLIDLGYGVPTRLRFVPVDFEANDDWYARLIEAGFDAGLPAVIASTGVSMYLTKPANRQVLDRVARFAPGSTLVMTFMLPSELVDADDRAALQAATSGAQASGTPFISFYSPDEMVSTASDAGFRTIRHVRGSSLSERYFTNRTDGLRPSSGEDLLIATT